MILDDIIEKRKVQLAEEMKKISLDEMKALAFEVKPTDRSFFGALRGENISVIAEIKKASPSKGIISESFDFMSIATAYEKSNVNAISVLTEEFYFKGSSEILKQVRRVVNVPIIRKDFIIHEYQIYEAKVIGADAILLIVAVLPKDTIIRFMEIAKSLSLDCLVEVHDEGELQIALECGATIIGINNRNLKTFHVDIDTTKTLARLIPKDCIIVSESGISTNSDMKMLKECGVNAVLIGETLMKSKDIEKDLAALRDNL